MPRRRSWILLLSLVPSAATGWGTAGHEAITRLAWQRIEDECLGGFFGGRLAVLLVRSMDPDRWRETDPDEAPRHYLNVDAAGDPAAYPRDFGRVVERFGPARAVQNGLVPWRTAEMTEALERAFVEADPARVADVAGYLAHYVGDAHSPLHATVNYDGQLTGQPGLHARWETDMPRRYRRAIEEAAAAMPVPLPSSDPVDGAFEAILSGLAVVPAILGADRADGSEAHLYAATGDIVARRWAEAAALLAALWLEAWARAGRPILPGMPAACAGEPEPASPPVPEPRPAALAAGGGGCSAHPDAGGATGALVLVVLGLSRMRRPRARCPRPS